MKQLLFVSLLGIFLFTPVANVQAQELFNETEGVYKATVIEVGPVRDEIVEGTGLTYVNQDLLVRLDEGPEKGKEVQVENGLIPLAVGDALYINHVIDIHEIEGYYLFEIDRSGPIAVLFGLFALLLVAFGGLQGFRALLALGGSLLAIIYILLPAIVAGYNPILVSVGIAAVILALALFFTHGFNRRSLVAFLGTVIAVSVTGLFALFAVDFVHLSGLASEETVYLNFNTNGSLDFVGLLLGAIIIGMLGALDDVAITQVAAVRELYGLDKDLQPKEAFVRAMRIGKEHVSALVNTLVLAYTGAALPLLLLFTQTAENIIPITNLELFATEIVRVIVGSIGLILTVPLTTLMAVWFMQNYRGKELEEGEHSHSHSH